MSVDQKIELTFTEGELSTIDTCYHGDDPVIDNFPGKFELTRYDPSYLRIERVEWLPSGVITTHPCLRIWVLPLKTGTTSAETVLQYDRFQPLFLTYQFAITITDHQ
jgi:hypothetical protein